jgi:hypothetical protein
MTSRLRDTDPARMTEPQRPLDAAKIRKLKGRAD